MKRSLFLTCILACITSLAPAATYTNLTESWCDETNKVIYDGQGYFAVQSAASTSIDITISLSALTSYVNSNDYRSGNYLLLWDDNSVDYGLADNADTTVETGSRVPYLTGHWNGSAWSTTNKVDYSRLEQYATDGSVTLYITNSNTSGVTVSVKNTAGAATTLYTASDLLTTSNTRTNGYHVNLNYVTAVTLNTPSTLDTANYVPPKDYSKPFVSERADTATSLGRVTFLGDSITHGVNDASYRWQLFKALVDNGIENEIAGPREGYFNTPNHTDDAGESYGGAAFANVHLAQASGRTHNIISGSTTAEVNGTTYSSGVNYGGHSTASTAAKFDSNTWFCLMGTNDLLSDTPASGTTTAQYATQMQKMLGGTVSYNETTDSYIWTAGDNWGSMATIVDDVCGEGDTFYALSITPWGNHNHNADLDHYAGQEFNRNLREWTAAYAKASGRKVVYVDVTRGMVDVSSEKRFMGHDAFFNSSSDRLHPNDQGSLLMAGNLARTLGIGGRTAGLERSGTSTWQSATTGTVAAGSSALLAENIFTMEGGYTLDFAASFGNGAENGWLSAENRLAISLGDGTHSGTLNLSESYIMWGDEVLFCQDTSALAAEGNLRIAWHNGNTADNVLSGYYVWLGDMLIGQGLQADTEMGLNGIAISALGAAGEITGLTWADTAYAPTTTGTSAMEYAYRTTQDAASVSGLVENTYTWQPAMSPEDRTAAPTLSGISYESATTVAATGGQVLVRAASDSASQSFTLTSGAGWTGLVNCSYAGDINAQVTGTTANTVFGSMNSGRAGKLTLEVAATGVVGNGSYNGQTAAIAGSYGGGCAEAFHVYVNGGAVQGDIVGGAVHGSGTVEAVKLVVNNGTVQGSLLGGSKTAGTVNEASITINGGSISGDIVAGGKAGTIGNTAVVINGGKIEGNITKGSATRSEGARATVTVVGNKAGIGGNITADDVTLRNVSESGYADGFDRYAGIITAEKLTLDNVQVDLRATLSVSAIELINGSTTSAGLGTNCVLNTLSLGRGSTFSAYKDAATPTAASAHESTLTLATLQAGAGATLNANIAFTADSALILEGSLTMGSDVALTTGMSLTLSESMLADLYGYKAVTLFTGVDNLTLDTVTMADGEALNANGVFSNLDTRYDYNLAYVGGMVSLAAIPEPATSTLSLLSLAALAARRRRK